MSDEEKKKENGKGVRLTPLVDANGKPVLDKDGKPVMESRALHEDEQQPEVSKQEESAHQQNGQPQQFGLPYTPQQFGQPANGRSFDSGVKVQQPEVSKQEEGTPYDNLQNPYEERRKGYEDIITQLKGEKADEEARERRNRARAAIGGIAEAGRALSSLYYTTQYAPETYKEGVSEQYRKRADEARAKRDKLRDELLNYYKQLGDNDVAAAGWDAQMARYKQTHNDAQAAAAAAAAEAEKNRELKRQELALKGRIAAAEQQGKAEERAENKRHHGVMEGIGQQKNNLQGQRQAAEQQGKDDKNNARFATKKHGTVVIPNTTWNDAASVAQAFERTPKAYITRDKATGEEIGRTVRPILTPDMTKEQRLAIMKEWIGKGLALNDERTEDALKDLERGRSTQTTTPKKKSLPSSKKQLPQG